MNLSSMDFKYLLYVIAIAGTSSIFAVTADVKDVVHPDNGECKSCHSSQKHPQVNRKVSAECVSCHAGNTASGSMIKVGEMSDDLSKQLQAQIGDGNDTGMSVPMYYEKTRIGGDPNEMVLIPAGEFIMGTDNRLPDEGPQHTAYVDAFYIDIYEVTNMQYKQFIDATRHKSPHHFSNRTYPEEKVDHPVIYVNWYDATDYCEWAGKRLPTDAEWEKAARGIDGKVYPWGDTFDLRKANMPQRWVTLKQEGDTTPVGAFKGGVSDYGLYDMSGNVWEWTSSWYMPYPGNTRITENYGEKYKTLKGGSWWDCSFYKCGLSAPTYNRSFFMRTTKNKSFGFRCAKDAPKSGINMEKI